MLPGLSNVELQGIVVVCRWFDVECNVLRVNMPELGWMSSRAASWAVDKLTCCRSGLRRRAT